MNKNKIRVMAYLISCSMLLSACGKTFKLVDFNNQPTFTTASTDSKEEESQESTETPNSESVTEPTIKEPKPTIKEPEPPITEPEETNDDLIVHATTDVNMCSSNTTESFQIGKIKVNDSAVIVLSGEDGWDLVRYNGILGYVCSEYLMYTEEKEDDEYSHEKKNDIVLTTTNLNFRQQPTTEGTNLDTLEPNTELQVLAEVDNGWLLVRHNGNLGYISSEYTISLLDKLNEKYPYLNMEQLEIKKVIYNNANELNLREEPNTECEILNKLERYETMRVIAESDEWSLVMTNDYNFGFVFKEYTKDLTGIFIDVDKSEQTLTMYNNNEVLVKTPVTTGKDSTPSDTGYFDIDYKQRNAYLMNNSFVEYWMPYNGGEGIHDASWRTVFGTDSYHTNGSHGCINTPKEAVIQVWEKAKVGTKVLVHK